ncbi:hypothetical protein MFLAVUS_001700 [Mucor flavus]|uniref:Uncharacterized protein n=1 Tax=Mucor flavus TaxID=439312 RepID=A0ABP9YN82_9FUNG
MSFSIDNTSFISSVTELDEGVGTTGTIESTTILEESSGTDVVVLTDITKTYSNDAPFTTTYATATADKLTPYTLNSDVTITQEPTAMNTTPLFPPVHRSNQVYSISPPPRTSVIYRQELIHYGRESNQTMGRANGHESILMGSSVTTRQNRTTQDDTMG